MERHGLSTQRGVEEGTSQGSISLVLISLKQEARRLAMFARGGMCVHVLETQSPRLPVGSCWSVGHGPCE